MSWSRNLSDGISRMSHGNQPSRGVFEAVAKASRGLKRYDYLGL